MKSVRKSLFFAFAENYSIIAIQFVSSLIVARLLTPAEIGLFSVAVLLVGFAHILRDFGVGQYIIQESDLTDDRIRTAFGLTLILGWGMGGVLFLASSPVAAFYGSPGVKNVMMVLAGNFLLIPFGSVTMAYMRRELNFAPLYRVKTISTLIHASTTVGLAYAGFSYMSMAWAAIIGTTSSILLVNLYRPRHLPIWPSLKEARRVFSFGSFASGASVVGEIGKASPDLIIGKVLNMEAVGLFGRAMGLIEIFNRAVMQSVWTVALPFFSSRNRNGGDVRTGYLKSASYLTAIAWPFFAFLGLNAQPIVRLLYGPQWDASIPLVEILCLWGALGAAYALAGQVLIAVGEVKRYFHLQLAAQASKVVLILFAAPMGLTAICFSLVIASALNNLITHRMLKGVVDIGLGEFFAGLLKSLGVTLFVAIPVAALPILVGNNGWLPFVGQMAVAAIAWLAGVFLLKHPLWYEISALLQKKMHRA